ncbi:hypothetical protein DIZ27_12310 [Streptomyces sp. NWU339]|uniref:FAD-dependent monooxygenase n=1 Tax=Streptomyces sp. NWU339 TaxID=2185284 RepID=UPI000D681B9F|nr:FAD-dependent monooxygenase [Streptomyces sp. NWU339]PWI10387.1 hypothetical protein DIZ27_12310 [Streptomyces sp. NWU339]
MNSRRVLIVGAGPTGLALAAALAQGGIRCAVIERRRERAAMSRAFTLEPRTMELLNMRGWMDDFLARGRVCPHPPLGDDHVRLDYGLLDTPFPFSLTIPQCDTETVLEKFAVNEGASVLRGTQVVALRQDEYGVELTLRAEDREYVERADFVVGCDGVDSTIRTALGVGVDSREYDASSIMADAKLRRPPDRAEYARITRRGMVAVFPFQDDEIYRVIVFDRERMQVPAELPLTLEELTASCSAILGFDIEPHDPRWMTRFRSSQRQAERYRVGRVLLAGDAAHTQLPSGGQGLQTGIQDAMNLEWKLRAELAGWAPPGLLDTYESERHPMATEILRKTDMSFRFQTSDSFGARLIRALVIQMMRFRALQRVNLEHLSGLALSYPAAADGRWAGRRMPDRLLATGGRVHELLRGGRFALLHRGPAPDVAAAWANRAVVAEVAAGDRRWPSLVLVRPDGYVAWSGTDPDGLRNALQRWCGIPSA